MADKLGVPIKNHREIRLYKVYSLHDSAQQYWISNKAEKTDQTGSLRRQLIKTCIVVTEKVLTLLVSVLKHGSFRHFICS